MLWFFVVIYLIISKMPVRYKARIVRQNSGYSKTLKTGLSTRVLCPLRSVDLRHLLRLHVYSTVTLLARFLG